MSIKVTSFKTVDFPSLGWSISKGETKELPADKEKADTILASKHIIKVPDLVAPVDLPKKEKPVDEAKVAPVEKKVSHHSKK